MVSSQSDELLHKTKSVCPVCLKTLPAELMRRHDEVILCKTCPEHGQFEAVIWRATPEFMAWQRPKSPIKELLHQSASETACPHDCGLCAKHKQKSCTVLFELTNDCNMHCPICFANSGLQQHQNNEVLPLEYVLQKLEWIYAQAGAIVLQLSGGEPTLYPDLIEVIRAGAKLFPAVQLNTNGLLLSEHAHMAQDLKKAGLSWVFLQFDGSNDDIYIKLRGQKLFQQKMLAIENCKKAGLDVVLVPTLVAGINDNDIGQILKIALSLAPTVRGIHLQPMTFSGRNMFKNKVLSLTLPEVLFKLAEQSEGMIKVEHANPPGCEHERCSFHCRYINNDGNLTLLGGNNDCCTTQNTVIAAAEGAEKSIETVIRSWKSSTSKIVNTEKEIYPNVLQDTNVKLMHVDEVSGLKTNNTNVMQTKEDSILQANANTTLQAKKNIIIGDNANTTLQKNKINSHKSFDSFDAFIARAKNNIFSITCMAFQDALNIDLDRLQGCCVHVYAEHDKLIPFCAYNLTSLDNFPLYRKQN